MLKSYFMPSKSLTAQLIGKDSCGPTHHKDCRTNYDWCQAECLEQNAKHGHQVFTVCHDGEGTVWVGLKDKTPANWVAATGTSNE